ncbi:phosphatidate cytidylyltransferase [Paenibacillus sp. IB182496]|uniref:Phosphatidate cytidylyltransferase n=1 Tax=Paenibacillus sabuli TaxID=2772509 RepID=A0A927GS16_9BACL|nr:phosphatidate cytidylyltransferase [Paenibacillus sabuli]MBD2845252.1 phosphatidate cytidylyltransferase [Paenibacillus sabuli]
MRQRIATGVVAGAVFAALVFAGGAAYTAMLVLLAIIGYGEYIRMHQLSWRQPAAMAGAAGMLVLVLPWTAIGLSAPSTELVMWLTMFLLLGVTVITSNRTTINEAAVLLLGAVYLGFGFSAMLEVRLEQDFGLYAACLAFGCIWASDIGAYFVGKRVGKRPLWPAISPNKTVEGALGGVALALVVSVLLGTALPLPLPFWQLLLIGFVCAVAGQFGDLIQSAYKRVRGVKDTGRLLPGHGGVLDRCDSWLIVFPLLQLTGLLQHFT